MCRGTPAFHSNLSCEGMAQHTWETQATGTAQEMKQDRLIG